MQVSLKVGQVISVFLYNQMEHHGRIYNLAGAYSFFSLNALLYLLSAVELPPSPQSIPALALGGLGAVSLCSI